MAAHHDAHFRAGLDDTGAVVAETCHVAKAMKMSGYRPHHDDRLPVDTAEEFGYTNCWYDWCIGAWYAITHTTRMGGQAAAMYSIELMARRGRHRWTSTRHPSWPLDRPERLARPQTPGLLPYGYTLRRRRAPRRTAGASGHVASPASRSRREAPSYGEMYHSTYEKKSGQGRLGR